MQNTATDLARYVTSREHARALEGDEHDPAVPRQ